MRYLVVWMLVWQIPAGVSSYIERQLPQLATSPTPSPVVSQVEFTPELEGTASTTQTPTPLRVSGPLRGQAVQGVIQLIANKMTDDQVLRAEFAFRYTDDSPEMWFIQEQWDRPANPLEINWDTTTITDSIYDLKLTYHFEDQEPAVFIVKGVRVRNYTPIETNTPTPLAPTPTPQPGEASGVTPTPTASKTPIPPTTTPLPPNPANLTSGDIAASFVQGTLVIIVLFSIGLLASRLKKAFSHHS